MFSSAVSCACHCASRDKQIRADRRVSGMALTNSRTNFESGELARWPGPGRSC